MDHDSSRASAARKRAKPEGTSTAVLLLLVAAVLLPILAAAGEGAEASGPPVLTGPVDREAVEQAVPDWVKAQVDSEIDPGAAAALAAVPPGATVRIYFGTWCSDSKRELSRLWRALDEVGGMVPFAIDYIAVDREKVEPRELTEGVGLLFVPTLLVLRDGAEVGRIIEESPGGIERDLLALLTGETEGVVSARDDVGAVREPAP